MHINVHKLEDILKISKRSICIIEVDNEDNNIMVGTGFFIKFPINNDSLCGLLTSHYILNEKKVTPGSSFHIIMGQKNKTKKDYLVTLKETDFIFTSKFINATFIQLDNELVNKIRPTFLTPDDEYNFQNDKRISLIQCEGKDDELVYTTGNIIDESGFNYIHDATTYSGSAGSPILNNEYKVVGLHTGKISMEKDDNNENEKERKGAKKIGIIEYAIRTMYNNKDVVGLDKARSNAKELTDNEIQELKNHGLKSTSSPYIYKCPESIISSEIIFYRTNHAWYWTTSKITNSYNKIYKLQKYKWFIIIPFQDNDITLDNDHHLEIQWLKSTGLSYLS